MTEPDISDLDVLDSQSHEQLWAIINKRHEKFNATNTWNIVMGLLRLDCSLLTG